MKSRETGGAEFSGPISVRNRMVDVLHLAFVFFLTLSLGAFFASRGMSDYDNESVIFKPAVDLLEGKMIFRDSFTQYGPLCAVLQTVAMKAFGKHIIVVKYEMVLFYAIVGIFLWLIWRRFSPRWLATTAIVTWNLMSYHFVHPFLAWASSYALLFQSITIFFLFRSLESGKFIYGFLAGVGMGLCFFCKQNVGFYLFCFAMVVPYLLLFLRKINLGQSIRVSTQIALGAVLSIAPFLIWFASTHALKDWYLQNIKWPQIWARSNGNDYHLLSIFRCLFVFPDRINQGFCLAPWIYLALPLITVGSFLVLTFRLRKNRDSTLISVWLLSFLALASWLQYYPVPGIGHLWWSSTPMFGISLFALHWLSLQERIWERVGIRWLQKPLVAGSLLSLLFFGPTIVRQLHLGWVTNFSLHYVRIPGNGPLAGMGVSEGEAKYAAELESTIQREVNDKYASPKVLLNKTGGLMLTFVKNLKPFHPMWPITYTQPIVALYPNFKNQLEKYIETENPVIFAGEKQLAELQKKYPSYHVVANVQNDLFILRSEKLE